MQGQGAGGAEKPAPGLHSPGSLRDHITLYLLLTFSIPAIANLIIRNKTGL